MAANPTTAPHRPFRAATIRDVAARAGVSVATVSRVFNSPDIVRDDTVSRVLEVARELSFVLHVGARNLSRRRTNTVGLLLPHLHGEFFSEVIREIDAAARGRGYHLLVSGEEMSDWDEVAAALNATRGRVDGLIVMSPYVDGDELRKHLPNALPAVLLNCPGAAGPSITIDNRGGVAKVMRHLGSLGHRRIAFINGPQSNADARERLRAYRTGLARLAGRGKNIELPGDFTEDGGCTAARMALKGKPRPTAIFAANDAMAIGALFALREAGVHVPREMAVVGFDDIPIARFVSPPLTTVGIDIASLGRRAVGLLLEVLDHGPGIQRCETLSTHLVIRESCGGNSSSSKTSTGKRIPPRRAAP